MLNSVSKILIAGVLAYCLSAASAFGQACEETQFSAKHANLYSKAENELINTKNYSAARGFLQQLRESNVNCYEKVFVDQLEANIFIGLGDYVSAARAYEALLRAGSIPPEARLGALQKTAQLFMQTENIAKALDYMNQWMRAGGTPDRNQKYNLAIMNFKQNKFNEAVKWAEDVYRIDGEGVKQGVVDLLFSLYDKTGNKVKRAQLLETMIRRQPRNEIYWAQLRSDLFQSDPLRGFQVYRAMYHAGLVKKKQEIMQLVDLYNQNEVFFHGARLLEKEMNAGRMDKNFENLEKLADLYQYSSEFKRSIPVLKQAAELDPTGKTFERIARSYLDIEEWKEAESWALKAINKGRLRSEQDTWLMVGQARYFEGKRSEARDAFSKAGRGGRDYLAYMRHEDNVACDTKINNVEQVLYTIRKEISRCKKLLVLGEANAPESCKGDTNEVRLAEEEKKLEAVKSCRQSS